MKGHGYFENKFKSKIYKLNAFLQGPFFLQNNFISISPWFSLLNSIILTSTCALKHPILVQFYGLSSLFRFDLVIQHLVQKIGEVLHIGSSNSYYSKTSRQRVRILVSSLEDLIEKIVPNIENMGIKDGVIVEYSSPADQCGKCRKMGHDSKLCPKNQEPIISEHNTSLSVEHRNNTSKA